MKLSLRNRITFFYLAATSLLIGILFVTIYLVVHQTVYNHLDGDLDTEASEIERNLVILNNQFIFTNKFEWNEKEHNQIEVNPVFVQVVDTTGKVIKKTGNLLSGNLKFDHTLKTKTYFNTKLSGKPTRQVQLPIRNPVGKVLGFIIIAMPLEESAVVLNNLFVVLVNSFWIVLFALFYITRFIAGASISPINKVISTAERITKENLDERIDLPVHRDEIYTLTSTINELLNRLEDAVLREKQFTSDASHELRTPLSVIKGTLEVLIRKPRDIEQYESKIRYCIDEVDRMSRLIDQLLMLARYESGKLTPMIDKINIYESITSAITRLRSFIDQKEIVIDLNQCENVTVNADKSMLETILENILSNAVKYSDEGKHIEISVDTINRDVVCSIKDYGIGMTEEQASKIFDRFYRADESRAPQAGGNGIGMAIVKKLADLQSLGLKIESKVNNGTSIFIIFPSKIFF
jgi:signal transduction histidine kinase